MGSGYTETYRAANGSQVVEQRQRQVGPRTALERPEASGTRGGGGGGGAAGPSRLPPPAGSLLLPRPRSRTSALRCQPQHLFGPQVRAADLGGWGVSCPALAPEKSSEAEKRGAWGGDLPTHGLWPVRSHRFPGLWGSPRALQPVRTPLPGLPLSVPVQMGLGPQQQPCPRPCRPPCRGGGCTHSEPPGFSLPSGAFSGLAQTST